MRHTAELDMSCSALQDVRPNSTCVQLAGVLRVSVAFLADFWNIEIPLVGDDYKGEIPSVYLSARVFVTWAALKRKFPLWLHSPGGS